MPSHLNLLVGLLLEVPRHSWRETLCGLRCKSSLEISYGDVHDRGVPCPLSSPEKWTCTSSPWCSPLQRELEPLADFPSWCRRISSSSPNVPEDLMMGRCLLPVIVAKPLPGLWKEQYLLSWIGLLTSTLATPPGQKLERSLYTHLHAKTQETEAQKAEKGSRHWF